LHHCIGDPRVQKTKIIWIEPALPWWVQNSSAEQKGELALEVTVEKDAAEENGDAWGVAMDVCIPVMHLIDITRSMPYSIQGVKHVFGISFAFNRITEVHVSSPLLSIQRNYSLYLNVYHVSLFASYFQHLTKAIGMVTKSVLKEHLTTVASSMTCTGNLHGFNSSGYKATFQSLNVQAPFTEATLSVSTIHFLLVL
jgi:DNA-directed RNA polymerase V subunit 1